MAIQIDMFEVQLGAGLLMQFDAPDGVVRVLADAGVHASGYAKDHVKKKLPAAFTAMGDARLRIDLVIGTHYDADHLDGLPPIISDSTYEIGEVWLPPVSLRRFGCWRREAGRRASLFRLVRWSRA
jgi:beta-lactamase superfamily II metal-dependent hydrolase